MYQWIFRHPENKYAFTVLEVHYANQLQGYLVFKTRFNAGGAFTYMEMVDEAILPLPETVRKQIIAKAYYTINKTATSESLLVMRSNSMHARASLRNLFGIPVKKVEKTYYKENFLQTGETPFLTSLDGDSIFF